MSSSSDDDDDDLPVLHLDRVRSLIPPEQLTVNQHHQQQMLGVRGGGLNYGSAITDGADGLLELDDVENDPVLQQQQEAEQQQQTSSQPQEKNTAAAVAAADVDGGDGDGANSSSIEEGEVPEKEGDRPVANTTAKATTAGPAQMQSTVAAAAAAAPVDDDDNDEGDGDNNNVDAAVTNNDTHEKKRTDAVNDDDDGRPTHDNDAGDTSAKPGGVTVPSPAPARRAAAPGHVTEEEEDKKEAWVVDQFQDALVGELDERILEAEEQDFLQRMDREISLLEDAEERKLAGPSRVEYIFAAPSKKRRSGEVHHEEGGDRHEDKEGLWDINWADVSAARQSAKRRRCDDGDTMVVDQVDEVYSIRRVTKLLPRRLPVGGRGDSDQTRCLVDEPQDFVNDLIQASRALEPDALIGFSISYEDDVPGDPDSWLLRVEGQAPVLEATLQRLADKFDCRLSSFNYEYLMRHGVELAINIDVSRSLGAQLTEFTYFDGTVPSSRLHIVVNKDYGQLASILGPAINRCGPAAVLKLDGVDCIASRSFTESIEKIRRENRTSFSLVLCVCPTGDFNGAVLSEIRLPSHCRDGAPLPASLLRQNATAPPPPVHPPSQPLVAAVAASETEKKGSASNRKDSVVSAGNTTTPDGQASYMGFRAKFKEAAEIEFKNTGVHLQSALSGMWQMHKREFGTKCDERCRCVYQLPLLTRTVAQGGFIKPWKQNSIHHVGFTGNFARWALPKLKVEFPDETPRQHLARLVSMWPLHQRTKNFGLHCYRDCECIQGWEIVFHQGSPGSMLKKKRKSAGVAEAGHPKAFPGSTSGSIPRKGMSSKTTSAASLPTEPASTARSRDCSTLNVPMQHSAAMKQLKEYSVTFDARTDLGFYCQTDNVTVARGSSRCMIISVFPRGQASKRDPRIQNGTQVVAASYIVKGVIGPRKKIFSHVELRRFYEDVGVGSDICLFLINTAVRRSSDASLSAYSKDWKADGFWIGKCTSGFDGRRQRPRLQDAVAAKVGNSHEQRPEAAAEAKSLPPVEEEWIEVEITKPAATKDSTKEVGLSATVTKKPMNRSVSFADTVEERRYEKEVGKSTVFFVKKSACISHAHPVSRSSPGPEQDEASTDEQAGLPDQEAQTTRSPRDILFDAVLNKTFSEAKQVFESGTAMEIGSERIFTQLHRTVKDRIKGCGGDPTELKCLKRKDITLKVYINAAHAALGARSLGLWTRFELSVQELFDLERTDEHLSVSVNTLMAGGNKEPVKQLLATLETRPASRPGVLSVVRSNKPFSMPLNTRVTPERCFLIEVNVAKNGETVSYGTVRILLSELHAQCGDGNEWFTIVKQVERGGHQVPGKMKILARRVPLETGYLKTKRSDLGKRIKTVIEWINRFNEELGEEKVTCGLDIASVAVSGRVTLLHSAVMLEDEALTKRLLDLGADQSAVSVEGTVVEILKQRIEDVSEKAKTIPYDPEDANGNDPLWPSESRIDRLKRIEKLLDPASSPTHGTES